MVTTFAWGPGWQYDVAATASADNVLASNCRVQSGHPSNKEGCRICVTVRLPVRPPGETIYWQANANTPFPLCPRITTEIIAQNSSNGTCSWMSEEYHCPSSHQSPQCLKNCASKLFQADQKSFHNWRVNHSNLGLVAYSLIFGSFVLGGGGGKGVTFSFSTFQPKVLGQVNPGPSP